MEIRTFRDPCALHNVTFAVDRDDGKGLQSLMKGIGFLGIEIGFHSDGEFPPLLVKMSLA